MEGTSFIARSAAKRRAEAQPAGQVVIHPVAIRHFFHGDLELALHAVLDDMERRLSWQPQRTLDLYERICKDRCRTIRRQWKGPMCRNGAEGVLFRFFGPRFLNKDNTGRGT